MAASGPCNQPPALACVLAMAMSMTESAHLHKIIAEHQEAVQSANSQLRQGKLIVDAEIMLISGFLLNQVPGALLAAIAFWGRYQPIKHGSPSWGPDPRSIIKTDSLIARVRKALEPLTYPT